jgi:translation initiation factor 2 subunit 3
MIHEQFSEPERKLDTQPIMTIVRSFDINKPGSSFEELKGGVLGGSIKEGTLKIGDEIEIRPGIMQTKGGKNVYTPIYAQVKGLKSDKDKLDEAIPGGSVAIMTELDPTLTKSDSLVGQIAGIKGELPEPSWEVTFKASLLEKVVSSQGEFDVKSLMPNEPLMLIVNSLATVGLVSKVNPQEVSVKLKRPVMAFSEDRLVIFRRFEGNKWRIIGFGIVK